MIIFSINGIMDYKWKKINYSLTYLNECSMIYIIQGVRL
jgi:hypothetical protein